MRDEQILLPCCPILVYCWMAVVCACFALLVLFNMSLMTYIRAVRMPWTPLYFKHLCIMWTSLYSIDTSPYCRYLFIMNAICILCTPLHTVDTSPLWMEYAYYGHLFILWTPLHAYYGHLSIMNSICILWIPLHSVDTSPLRTQYAYYRHLCILQTHTMDTFAYKSLLHTPLHKLWTPLHTKETYAQYGPLSILQTHCIVQSTPTHTCTMDTYA